jgi:hypothetical protein
LFVLKFLRFTFFAETAYQQPDPSLYPGAGDGQQQMYDPNYYQQQYYDPMYYYYQQYPMEQQYAGQQQFPEHQQLPDQQFQDQQLQQMPEQQPFQSHLLPEQELQHQEGFQDHQLPRFPDHQLPDQQQTHVAEQHHFHGHQDHLSEQRQEHQSEPLQQTPEHHPPQGLGYHQQVSEHSSPVHALHLEEGREMVPGEQQHQQRQPVDGGNEEVSTPSVISAPPQQDYEDNLNLPMERLVLVMSVGFYFLIRKIDKPATSRMFVVASHSSSCKTFAELQ